MNEAYVTQRLMGKMRQAGYLARKIQGGLYTADMPDLYVCSNHRVIFFEVKFLKVSRITDAMRIPLKVSTQMLSMQDHDLKGRCYYLLYWSDGSSSDLLTCIQPHVVRALVDSKGLIGREMMRKESEWLRKDLPDLFRESRE